MPTPRTSNETTKRSRRGRMFVAAIAIAAVGLVASPAIGSSTSDGQDESARAAIVKTDASSTTHGGSWGYFRGGTWA